MRAESAVLGGIMIVAAYGLSAGPVHACVAQQLITSNFEGTSCADINGEKRSGRTVLDDGSVFDGDTSIVKVPNTNFYDEYKSGTLQSSAFNGSITHYQTFQDANGSRAALSGYTSRVGEEILPTGELFIGSYSSNQIGTAMLSTRVGKLTTPLFNGATNHFESSWKNAQGAVVVYSSDQYSGTWTYSPSQKLSGRLAITHNSDGTVNIVDNRK